MNDNAEQAEGLPVHHGDTPPEDQVRGMAAPDDLDDSTSKEEGSA
jgi:hypothetical protein